MDSIPDAVEYRDVPGYPGYRVGDDGSVWSCKYGTWKQMRTPTNGNGYPTTALSRNDQPWQIQVHQLVLLVFVGPCPQGMETCHNNDVKTDNRLSNLRYGTRKDNWKDRKANGRLHNQQGLRNPNAKLTPERVRSIRARCNAGESRRIVALSEGVSLTTIRNIMRGLYWRDVV